MEKLRQNPFYLILLPVAMMFLGFTSMRIPGTKIGPGELLLFVWIALTLVVCIKFNTRMQEISKKTLIVFSVMLGSSTIGSVCSFVIVYASKGELPFDINELVGFILCFAMSIALTLFADKKYVMRVLKIFCIVSSFVFFVFYLINAIEGRRLTVWAENPNQTANYCFIIVAISFILFFDKTVKFRLVYLLCCVAALQVGLATLSDGFKMGVYALAACTALFLIIKHINKAVVWIGLLLAVAAVLIFIPEVTLWFQDYLDSLSVRDQDQARYNLWSVAFTAFLHSPVFGNGMRAHSGLSQPFSFYDAHNFPIDLLVRVGLVGFIAMVIWLAYLLKPAIKNRNYFVLATFVAFIILSVTRALHRMPVVYMYFLSIYYLSIADADTVDEPAALPCDKIRPLLE